MGEVEKPSGVLSRPDVDEKQKSYFKKYILTCRDIVMKAPVRDIPRCYIAGGDGAAPNLIPVTAPLSITTCSDILHGKGYCNERNGHARFSRCLK